MRRRSLRAKRAGDPQASAAREAAETRRVHFFYGETERIDMLLPPARWRDLVQPAYELVPKISRKGRRID
jgi:hypothetical protein